MGGVERWLLSLSAHTSIVVGKWEVETVLFCHPGKETGDLCVGDWRLGEGVEREYWVFIVCVILFHSKSLATLQEAQDALNVVSFSVPVLPHHQRRAGIACVWAKLVCGIFGTD